MSDPPPGHYQLTTDQVTVQGISANDNASTTTIVGNDTDQPPTVQRIRIQSIYSKHDHSASNDGSFTLTTPLLVSSSMVTKEDSDGNPLLKEDEAVTNAFTHGLSDSTNCCDIHSRAYLYLCSILLLTGWVFNNVGWIYVSMYFGQMYGFWCDQSTAIIYIVLMAPVVLYRMYGSKTISPEMRETVHWRVYAIMGLLDALYNLLTGMASPYTSAPVQNLIFQLPIPIALLCVKTIWPHTRFTRGQYLGSVIIVIGAVLSVLPQLIHPVSMADAGEQDNRWSALIVYSFGVIFYGLNTVYKSYALKNAPTIDYWYVSLVENIWAFGLGFALLPLLWIPGVSVDTPTTTWPHFVAGAKCMFLGVSDLDPTASCQHIWWISILWIISNIGVNVLGLVVCRIGDSVVFNIINSVQLPITNLCYTSSFIMTAALATQFSPMMWLAVACVTFGFVIYQFIPLQQMEAIKDDKLLLEPPSDEFFLTSTVTGDEEVQTNSSSP